jgi:hypothetical protein
VPAYKAGVVLQLEGRVDTETQSSSEVAVLEGAPNRQLICSLKG